MYIYYTGIRQYPKITRKDNIPSKHSLGSILQGLCCQGSSAPLRSPSRGAAGGSAAELRRRRRGAQA